MSPYTRREDYLMDGRNVSVKKETAVTFFQQVIDAITNRCIASLVTSC